MKKYLSYGYVIFGAACWGFIGVFNRLLGTVDVSVWNRVFLRNFPSFVLLTASFALFHREVFHIQKKHLPLFFGSGIVSVLGMAVTYFNCQLRCSLAVAGILLYLAPSFVVLASAVLWKTPLTRRKIAALLLALVGCALVSGLVGGGQSGSAAGILLGIGSALCYASYTIFAHYGLKHYDSYTMIYWTFAFAGLGSLLFLDYPAVLPAFTTTRGHLGTVGLVLIATVLPYLFYTKGLEGVESGKAAIIANVEPVVAAITGIVFYDETPGIWTLLGILCVLGGVVLLAKEDENGEAEG